MKARIYKPTNSAMQSGSGKDSWILEFTKRPNSLFIENVMGRTSSSDMSNEVKIAFPTKEAAKEFATNQGYEFEVIKPKKPRIIKKSYIDNFLD